MFEQRPVQVLDCTVIPTKEQCERALALYNEMFPEVAKFHSHITRVVKRKTKDQNMDKAQQILLAILVELLSDEVMCAAWRKLTFPQQTKLKTRIAKAINGVLIDPTEVRNAAALEEAQ